jgi:hypothetical protein
MRFLYRSAEWAFFTDGGFAMIGLAPFIHCLKEDVMKKLLLTTIAISALSVSAFAADATGTASTDVNTDVSTKQNSGLVIGDKTHIKGDVYTGSNTADTRVSTDTSTNADARASDTRTIDSNNATDHSNSGELHASDKNRGKHKGWSKN